MNLNTTPFNQLPFNGEPLFSATCDYLIYLFERIDETYRKLSHASEEISTNLTDPKTTFDLASVKSFFSLSENFVDLYSKIIKCTRLSLGLKVGKKRSNHKIFNDLNYKPNQFLQKKIVHGLRNTQQHFEERLQDDYGNIDSFIKIEFSGVTRQWTIEIGTNGFKSYGSDRGGSEVMNMHNLKFHSYIKEASLLQPYSVSMGDIWDDTKEMLALLKNNMQEMLQQSGPSHSSRFTYFGVIVTPCNQQQQNQT